MGVIRICFAIFFLGFRCVYWPIVTLDFWKATLKSSAPKSLLIFWYICNVGLTLLQYFWGILIVKGIIKKLRGGSSAAELRPARELTVPLPEPDAEHTEE